MKARKEANIVVLAHLVTCEWFPTQFPFRLSGLQDSGKCGCWFIYSILRWHSNNIKRKFRTFSLSLSGTLTASRLRDRANQPNNILHRDFVECRYFPLIFSLDYFPRKYYNCHTDVRTSDGQHRNGSLFLLNGCLLTITIIGIYSRFLGYIWYFLQPWCTICRVIRWCICFTLNRFLYVHLKSWFLRFMFDSEERGTGDVKSCKSRLSLKEAGDDGTEDK